jgi:aminoglycoside phosphotransferase (APT) family kinase protein
LPYSRTRGSTEAISESPGRQPENDGSPVGTAAVRPGDDLNWPVVQAHLRQSLTGLEGDLVVLQFTSGAANLTYLLTFGDTRLVLRRPPFGQLAPGAHDMKREYRVLSRLGSVYDKAPLALLFCDDPEIAGADFFVMEYRKGVTIRDSVPEPLGAHANLGMRIGDAFVDAVAELHTVDPASCQLSDIGRPHGFVDRQIAGWSQRWDLARRDGATPLMDELATRLARSAPSPQRVSVLHNDMHLGNCQFDPGDPDRVKSIFDWDMATLGDPLIDFGSLLAYWRDETDFPSAGSSREDLGLRLPTRSEASARYAAMTHLDLSDIDWYHAFARWRIAIIMQQLYNRWAEGNSTDQKLSGFQRNVPMLAEAARCLLEGERWNAS